MDIASDLSKQVERLRFSSPVTHVYNPLAYAWKPHRLYLERFGGAHPEVVLLGMNPGPFGMAQTGVPFGDVVSVREWMGIDAAVTRPENEHPRRPVLGFESTRREVSGSRLWGWARDRFGSPELFFQRFLVLNYCPLCFLESTGRNRTPPQLPRRDREPLHQVCDNALRDSMAVIEPRLVVGVGAFAAERARDALGGVDVRVGQILHPSPASPRANRGWADAAEKELSALGVAVPGIE